jgi:hypothetical protein
MAKRLGSGENFFLVFGPGPPFVCEVLHSLMRRSSTTKPSGRNLRRSVVLSASTTLRRTCGPSATFNCSPLIVSAEF